MMLVDDSYLVQKIDYNNDTAYQCLVCGYIDDGFDMFTDIDAHFGSTHNIYERRVGRTLHWNIRQRVIR